MLLFVYGTLLKGEENAAQLKRATFVGRDCTLPQYTLLNLGPYPGLVASGESRVCGEVYEVGVDLLQDLDAFEEHPEVYVRTQISLASGVAAFTYVLRPEFATGAKVIASGNWRQK